MSENNSPLIASELQCTYASSFGSRHTFDTTKYIRVYVTLENRANRISTSPRYTNCTRLIILKLTAKSSIRALYKVMYVCIICMYLQCTDAMVVQLKLFNKIAYVYNRSTLEQRISAWTDINLCIEIYPNDKSFGDKLIFGKFRS